MGAGGPGSVHRAVGSRPGPGARAAASRCPGRPGAAEEWLAWHRRALDLAPPVEIAFRAEGALDQGGSCRVTARRSSCPSRPRRRRSSASWCRGRTGRRRPGTTSPGTIRRTSSWCARRPRCCATCCASCATRACSPRSVLTALPLDAARFAAGSMFRPLFDAVGDLLAAEPLVPVAGGGYGVSVDLDLAAPEVRELLTPGQLGALCGADRPSGSRTSPSPSSSPRRCGATCGTRSASTRSRPTRWCRW